jgi:hypothetical protein
MQGSLDSPPIVIRASRFFRLLACLFAGRLTASLFRQSRQASFDHHFFLIAFCCGTFYFALQLFRPAILRLSHDGVTWKVQFGEKHWSWVEISNFRVQGFGAIGCDLASADSDFKWLRPFNKAVSGNSGALGFGWEGGGEAVVALLTEARQRWG